MTSLLIATARALLIYDTASKHAGLVELDRSSYYGISWFPGGSTLFLSHNAGHGNLSSIDAYLRSEIGFISNGRDRQSPEMLSNPHQIRCLEPPFIAATNTGRNALVIINTTDWSSRQIRFDDVHWDRFDPLGQGSHFNSIDFDGQTVAVLAHNFEAGSYLVEFDWPMLGYVRRREVPGRQLHNLWRRDDGSLISCDSPNGGLIELNSGRPLWRHGQSGFYTRGLASSSKKTFVGLTEVADRDERPDRPSRVAVLDAANYLMEETVELGQFGDVTEIRVLDELDLCHPVGPLGNPDQFYHPQPAPVTIIEKARTEPANQKHAVRNQLGDMIFQRDHARDIAQEALAQNDRLSRERAAMMMERDNATAAKDEAVVQQARLQRELNDRIRERDEAITLRDEAIRDQARLQRKSGSRAMEREEIVRRNVKLRKRIREHLRRWIGS